MLGGPQHRLDGALGELPFDCGGAGILEYIGNVVVFVGCDKAGYGHMTGVQV